MAAKPSVLLLCLSTPPWFDEMYESLLNQLSERAIISRATSSGEATTFLRSNSPAAILAVDSGIADKKNSNVLNEVLSYVRGGGTFIIGCMFSSFISPPDMGKFFANMGLPWTFGDYHRTTVHLNKDVLAVTKNHLYDSYSQKAVFLKNVDSKDAMYRASADSVTQSRVFAAESVDTRQAPVAWKALERGWVGYIGDVNAELESHGVILAMCKL